MPNPYEPGTVEYLDYATAQHDTAMKPKPKKKKKKMVGVKPSNPVGLASSLIENKNKSVDDTYDAFMSGKSRIKR